MSLVHEFVVVSAPINKNILYSEEVYEYIIQGQIKECTALKIPDDVIQRILYDVDGKLLPDIQFNRWGISVYEKEELIKWIDFLENILEKKPKQNKEYYHNLLELIIKSYVHNNVVLHFGI